MNLSIDRLTLSLSGLSERDGRRLARLVSEGLAAAVPATAPDLDIANLRVSLDERPGEPVEATARRIVAQLLRAMEVA